LEALLMGRIFDDRGNRMSPSHSRKGAARHRCYVSSALIQGQPQSGGSVARVPAAKIEAVVLDAVRRHVGHDAPVDNTELVTTYVRQIEVRRTEIAISPLSEDHASEDEKGNPLVLTVPWSKTPHRRHRDIIAPEGSSRTQVLPIRSDTRTKLVTAIAGGRQWLSEIEAGAATIDGIASRQACSRRHVNMTISLAFLAPNLVQAAVEGRLPHLPHGIGVARLSGASLDRPALQELLDDVRGGKIDVIVVYKVDRLTRSELLMRGGIIIPCIRKGRQAANIGAWP
jgi:hypothetical protein